MILIEAEKAREIFGIIVAVRHTNTPQRRNELSDLLGSFPKVDLALMVIALADVAGSTLSEEEITSLGLELANASGFVALMSS